MLMTMIAGWWQARALLMADRTPAQRDTASGRKPDDAMRDEAVRLMVLGRV
jgi:UPF0716 family protein affecting phage T7 exclusion